jgi:glycosyltransferase involved in cell wall biosynthesis
MPSPVLLNLNRLISSAVMKPVNMAKLEEVDQIFGRQRLEERQILGSVVQGTQRPPAILVTSRPGQPTCAEFERKAQNDEWPRRDYVELAKKLDAVVIDSHYIRHEGSKLARQIARRAGMPAGQVAETFRERNQYGSVVAWSDKLGLLLALLNKARRSHQDIILVSVWLSNAKKALPMRTLRAHRQLRAIVNYGSRQMKIAEEWLGVPREKLYLALQPVDEQFWRPTDRESENAVCVVGGSYPHTHPNARDFATLLSSVTDLDLSVQMAVGNSLAPKLGTDGRATEETIQKFIGRPLPPNVRLNHLDQSELRDLYSRSRFAIIPLKNVEFDAGVTAITEAMAMGKAVIVSRTKGQIDIVQEGVQGIFVTPEDPVALRSAIEYLMAHPEEAERMGRAGRTLVERCHTLDAYVDRLASIVRGV